MHYVLKALSLKKKYHESILQNAFSITVIEKAQIVSVNKLLIPYYWYFHFVYKYMRVQPCLIVCLPFSVIESLLSFYFYQCYEKNVWFRPLGYGWVDCKRGYNLLQLLNRFNCQSVFHPCGDVNPGHESYQLKPYFDEMWKRACLKVNTGDVMSRISTHNATINS